MKDFKLSFDEGMKLLRINNKEDYDIILGLIVVSGKQSLLEVNREKDPRIEGKVRMYLQRFGEIDFEEALKEALTK